ncbi:MAG: hypothetical protein HeimC3_09080 [Candidatus Heimdallarchaeota archaeon LC_3]|nr:MAG: hypothetical protein HeimC3_09080 [Candidatus Heimdallarchaeota archaeon LC_3]
MEVQKSGSGGLTVQIPGLAHRLKLFHTSDSRTFLIFFIMRGGREDEYARKPILGRTQQAFEKAIKQCLQEGGFSHQVQGTVISQLARKLQLMEEQYAPPNVEEARSTTKRSPIQELPDFSSFISETKQILDQFQRAFVQNK